MEELPDLPFEKVLSYLNLKDLLKARAVSRRWYVQIDRLRVRSLAFSELPRDFIFGKRRWFSDSFAKNFISSTRPASFFATFHRTILSNLKHLRLCDLRLGKNAQTYREMLASIIHSFDQLEELDIIRFNVHVGSFSRIQLDLNLPMLRSVQLRETYAIYRLTLNAPALKKVTLLCPFTLEVNLVHSGSVETLITWNVENIALESLKNLKCVHLGSNTTFDRTLLSNLKQLKEIHLTSDFSAKSLFEQKQLYDRSDLEIFLCGLPVSDQNNFVAIFWDAYDYANVTVSNRTLHLFVENRSRLADEIPFCRRLFMNLNNDVACERLLKRCTNLEKIIVPETVQDIEQFLGLLKHCENIGVFEFWGVQPQDLFDRLPEHFTVQRLVIRKRFSDFRFLFNLSRLKNLIGLELECQMDAETVRKILEDLPFISYIKFYHKQIVEIRVRNENSKQFRISAGGKNRVGDLEATIRFIKRIE